jgi:hypothetical protein
MIVCIAILGLLAAIIIALILGFRMGVLVGTASSISVFTLNHEPTAEEIVRIMHELLKESDRA